MKFFVLLLALTLAVSCINAQRIQKPDVVVLTNPALQTAADNWVKSMENVYSAAKQFHNEKWSLIQTRIALLKKIDSAFATGADAKAKMSAVKKIVRERKVKHNPVLKLRLRDGRKMKKALHKAQKKQKRSWRKFGTVLREQIKRSKELKSCAKKCGKNGKKCRRALQSVITKPVVQKPVVQKPVGSNKWCGAQKAGSAEKKFCDSWSAYHAMASKEFDAKSKLHREVMNLKFTPLKKCAAAMEKDIADLKSGRVIRRSTKQCLKQAKHGQSKKAIKIIRKAAKNAKLDAKKYWRLFLKSFRALKKGPKPPTRGINIVKVIGMKYKKAVKFIKKKVVLGQADKRVTSIRAVKIDGKGQAVTKD